MHYEVVPIRVKVNGQQVVHDVKPWETALDFLRERLGLTGAKRSCDMQVCGTCTVLVDGKAVSSCTYLAYELDGAEVLTIEGLAEGGQLDEVQQAFFDVGGFQCGFCTPGFIMAVKGLVLETSESEYLDDEDLVDYLNGNICRCTGYQKIVEAVRTVFADRRKTD